MGAQAVGLVTHAAPALYGESLTEAYLTRPAVMGDVGLWGGRVELRGMLNLEGLTLERGELNAGIWGEGYIDRRHPHTYLHEAMGTVRLAGGPERAYAASLSFGKGFAPFGTDDPMVRPFVKYPINHHLAQVLERLVAVAAVRAGPAIVEAGVFNGDEPGGPSHLATPRRFGDSWAARGTLTPAPGLEVSASHAFVSSPEHSGGDGLDQRKWSAAARYERGAWYALLEWARTGEYDDGRHNIAFTSVLGEAALRLHGGTELAARYERTHRPDEERLLDPFRSARPHADVHLLGVTRWDAFTVRASHAASAAGFRLAPFVEVARLHARQTLRPAFFVPAEFYGSDGMWSLSLGMRVEVGSVHPRMGRYGAAVPLPLMQVH